MQRIVLMLVIIVLLFVISWAPLLTVNFLLKFAIITPSTRTITMLSSSTHLLAFANSCFNPFVYALLSKNFRESTKQVLRQCCGGTDTARFQNRPSLSSTRLSRLGSSMPRWKSLRGANEAKEDYVWCVCYRKHFIPALNILLNVKITLPLRIQCTLKMSYIDPADKWVQREILEYIS